MCYGKHNIQTKQEKHEAALSLRIRPGTAEWKHIFTFSKCLMNAFLKKRIGNYDLWYLEIKLAIKGSTTQTLSYVDPKSMSARRGQPKTNTWAQGRRAARGRVGARGGLLHWLKSNFMCTDFTDEQPGRGQLEKCDKKKSSMLIFLQVLRALRKIQILVNSCSNTQQ